MMGGGSSGSRDDGRGSAGGCGADDDGSIRDDGCGSAGGSGADDYGSSRDDDGSGTAAVTTVVRMAVTISGV